uniref:Iron-sulfur cluster formation ABC transporter n=1 Tax=Nitzschia sp. IriIs04 TaxID=1444690 RepID=A0A0S3QPL2_9STRA|nr:iron-sulfur cluster formation ABC transporter [Nitzschia sp. IriIs04]BAT70268.1 iron-sulfur cluster formation ABC transporter [Nitzschia sp. IriIs04]
MNKSFNKNLNNIINKSYFSGFTTLLETEVINKGLNESIVKLISEKKKEPIFLLNFRLKAYLKWKKIKNPEWPYLKFSEIDYNNIIYYSAPKLKSKYKNSFYFNKKLLDTFNKLGISLNNKNKSKNIAIDAVFDSISVKTTFKSELKSFGIIFCSISDAIKECPKLIKKFLGSVVPIGDNYFSALNSAVFSEGSFCYIPKNIICPLDLSTYFRINNTSSGQFERTLIIVDENSKLNYLEGCTASKSTKNQLHAAIVEIICFKNSIVKYSTIQNWYSGNFRSKGGIYNFVTKRGICLGFNSKISWIQLETGSSITWKYPSCILMGNQSKGEFYSVSLTTNFQQTDTGTKMIHIGKSSKSKIISKGISIGNSKNTYRGYTLITNKAKKSKNYSKCDSLLIKNNSNSNTFPYIYVQNPIIKIEHEASTSKISEDQIFYFLQRGISLEIAIDLLINGFCQDILTRLPLEFAIEANKLLSIKLEKSIG